MSWLCPATNKKDCNLLVCYSTGYCTKADKRRKFRDQIQNKNIGIAFVYTPRVYYPYMNYESGE